ncbi:MAG TPA: S41 family peptidase, partial [Myxococcaceae bacterium]
MNRWWHLTCLVLAACSTPPRPPPEHAFDPKPWLEDLAQLEDALGQHYANLEWDVRHQGLDAAALDRTAREAISRAGSEREALEAMVRFIAAFRDPHLSWTLPQPRIRYDLRFTSDGSSVRIQRAGPAACGAQPGDVVEAIQGRPALEQLQVRLPLARMPNLLVRREEALGTFTSSSLASPEALRFTFVRESVTRECVLTPRAPDPAPPAPDSLTADTPGVKACEALGITAASAPASPLLFRPERHSAFTPAAAPPFGAGTVRLDSGAQLGWLRIPLFSEEAFPAFCAQAWDAFRAHLTGPCDEQCRGDFDGEVLISGLVGAIAAQLDAFRTAKVSGVVVDISDNGGGGDWVLDTARLLSTAPLSCPAGARVRESAAVESAAHDVKEAESCGAPPPDVAWAKAVQAEIAQPCDWRPVFRTGAPVPECSMLTRSRRSPCYPSIGAGLPCAAQKPPLDGGRERGLRGAPLYVLMNRNTASAAELFAAILRDNGAATLVGERSLGAGCGYIDGANRIQLRHSGLKLRAPNCVRFRRDGANEVDGIAPDRA